MAGMLRHSGYRKSQRFRNAMIIYLQWVIFSLLSLVGGLVIFSNWMIPMQPKGGSLIPVIGGLFAAIAFAVAPIDALRGLWWLPLIADLGCAPMLTLAAGAWMYRAISGKN